MKLAVFSVYLLVCFSVFSCSHNPYESLQEVEVGNDKAYVLDKVGSPLRSRHQNGKNIWTYRFYSEETNGLVYKDIILDGEKVVEIRNAKESDIKDIEKKEKLVEESLMETKAQKEKPQAAKPAVDDSILTDSSKKKDDATFTPVE